MVKKIVIIIIVLVLIIFTSNHKKEATYSLFSGYKSNYLSNILPFVDFVQNANAWVENIPQEEKYLILTTSPLVSSLDSFKFYRDLEYNVVTRTVDGLTQQQIKDIIISEQTNLKYILIVGTINSVPNPNTDIYYSDIDDNNLADYALGRLPTDNPAHISYWSDKLINFETQENYNIHKVLFAGTSEPEPGVEPLTGWRTGRFWDEEVVPDYSGWTISKIYCYCHNEQTEYLDNGDRIVESMNTGQTVVALRGHTLGDGTTGFLVGCGTNTSSRFNIVQTTRLTSMHIPIFIAYGCNTIVFGATSTLYNSLLFTQDYGAVVFIGSTHTTGYPPELVIELTNQDTVGDAFLISNRVELYPSKTHLLGDPATKLR